MSSGTLARGPETGAAPAPAASGASVGYGAPRRTRRFWFDPRFAIGLALIAVSIVAMIAVLSLADTRVPVLSASHALVPGDVVHADDFTIVKVSLADAAASYVGPDDLPDAGLVVSRTIEQGELAPAASLGAADEADLRSVVVDVTGRLPASVEAGTTVDVWAAEKSDGGFAPPEVVVDSAIVREVQQPQGIVVDGAGASVEVLVPADDVAAVLGASADDARISLVPTTVPRG